MVVPLRFGRRKHLTRARSLKFWPLLNSSFGIWLLSAIFISGSGAIYRCYETEHIQSKLTVETRVKNEQDRIKRIALLDREISYRFSQVLERLADIQGTHNLEMEATFGKRWMERVNMLMRQPGFFDDPRFQHIRELEMKQADEVDKIALSLRRPPATSFDVLAPELSQSSVTAMIAELGSLCREPARPVLDRTRIEVSHLSAMYSPLRAPPAKMMALTMERTCILKRWKSSAFPLTTCSGRDPFCGEADF